MATSSVIDKFLHAIETATIPACEAWSGGAVLDATVPNWRLRACGPEAIRAAGQRVGMAEEQQRVQRGRGVLRADPAASSRS